MEAPSRCLCGFVCSRCRDGQCGLCGAGLGGDDPAEHRTRTCANKPRVDKPSPPCGLCRLCCEAHDRHVDAGLAGPGPGRASEAHAARILAAARAGDLQEASRLERYDVQLSERSFGREWPAVRAVRAALRDGEFELAWALATTSERLGCVCRDRYYSCVSVVLKAELKRVCALEVEAGPAAGEAAAAAVFARLERPLTIWDETIMYQYQPVGHLRNQDESDRRWLVGVTRALVAQGVAPSAEEVCSMWIQPEDEEFAAALLEHPRLATELEHPHYARLRASPAFAKARRWTPPRAAWLQARARAARPDEAGHPR